jgi:chromosome segregation ATPase
LESEFDENRALLADRDRKLLSTAADSQQSIERLKSIVAELQEEKSTLKADFSKQQAKLHEIEAAQARLVRKNSLFTQKDHLLREECRQLQALEQDWKAEREKLKNEEEKLRLHVQTLEAKVSDKEQKAELAWRRTSDVEKKLEERASVLSQMVQLNQNLECELAKEKSSSHLTGVTMEQLRQDLEAKNEEASRLKNDLLRKEEQFEETLHQERMQREIAESNLKSLKSQLNNVRLDSKAISDLQKENVELLAKVKRQEAMIKRKIDKDKALRNRTTFLTNSKDAPSCPTNAKDPMATPGRGGSTVKPPRGIISSVTTKDHMATPGRGGSSMIPPRGFSTSVKIARSCQSIASDVSSVSQDDWELDSVLYD